MNMTPVEDQSWNFTDSKDVIHFTYVDPKFVETAK